MNRDERQLVDLLNEKIRGLQHERAELQTEVRRLKKQLKAAEAAQTEATVGVHG